MVQNVLQHSRSALRAWCFNNTVRVSPFNQNHVRHKKSFIKQKALQKVTKLKVDKLTANNVYINNNSVNNPLTLPRARLINLNTIALKSAQRTHTLATREFNNSSKTIPIAPVLSELLKDVDTAKANQSPQKLLSFLLGLAASLPVFMYYNTQYLDKTKQSASESTDSEISDDEDRDSAQDKKYHLNYQLNSRAYDAVTMDNQPMGTIRYEPQLIVKSLTEEDKQYLSAYAAVIHRPKIPTPKPEDYGLWALNQHASILHQGLSADRLAPLGTIAPYQPFDVQGKGNLTSLLGLKNLRQSIKSLLDYEKLATGLIHQHHQFQADCEQVDQSNFERQLNEMIVIFQHRCFVKGIPWEAAIPFAKTQMSQTILKTHPYAIKQPMLAHAAMYARLKQVHYSVHQEGGRFKAHKKTSLPLVTHTQIRTASGKIYALLNELNDADSQALFSQYGMTQSGPFVLGEGTFGKVRLAQELSTGKIVAVKKMFSRSMANHEIEKFGHIPPDDHLLSLYDYAHVRTSDGENKSYLFMELVGDVNGTALVQALATRRQKYRWGRDRHLMTQAILECSVAVIKLHELGIYHCDIKPENFFISLTSIHLGDYGLATKDKRILRGSSIAYNPKDNLYDAEKHDAFALGITFYELMHGAIPSDLNQPAKTKDTASFAGNTLTECVDKLRDEDPEKRITVREFIQLPFMQTLLSKKQRAALRDLILNTKH